MTQHQAAHAVLCQHIRIILAIYVKEDVKNSDQHHKTDQIIKYSLNL